MKTAATILFVMQAFAIMGSFVNGNAMEPFSFSPSIIGVAECVGYYLPTIIGVILLAIDQKRKSKK